VRRGCSMGRFERGWVGSDRVRRLQEAGDCAICLAKTYYSYYTLSRYESGQSAHGSLLYVTIDLTDAKSYNRIVNHEIDSIHSLRDVHIL
jgi:hypothetical protein